MIGMTKEIKKKYYQHHKNVKIKPNDPI